MMIVVQILGVKLKETFISREISVSSLYRYSLYLIDVWDSIPD